MIVYMCVCVCVCIHVYSVVCVCMYTCVFCYLSMVYCTSLHGRLHRHSPKQARRCLFPTRIFLFLFDAIWICLKGRIVMWFNLVFKCLILVHFVVSLFWFICPRWMGNSCSVQLVLTFWPRLRRLSLLLLCWYSRYILSCKLIFFAFLNIHTIKLLKVPLSL